MYKMLIFDQTAFNFSHQINELSFGPYYPSLINPLDNTIATTSNHFFKFQYYLSIVPTIYTDNPSLLKKISSSSPDSKHLLSTNQYAVTSQSHPVGESWVPGVFFKFDIEPITLTVAEEWGGWLALVVRLVNVVSGVMVAGSWGWRLWDWGLEVWGRRGRGRGGSLGMLGFGEKVGFD